MAMGNLFDNTNRKHEEWRAWSGDMSFRQEDIDVLVQAFNATKANVTLFMNAKVKTASNGNTFLQITLGKVKEQVQTERSNSPAAPEPKAPPVEEPSDTILTLDDL
mgnify:CR=1 FL=1